MPIPDPTPTRSGDADVAGPPPFRRLSPAQLREWVRAAKPGARIVYSRGSFVGQHIDREVVELVRALHHGGFIRMHLSRPERGAPIDYLAIRRQRPMLAGTKV